VLRIGTVVVDGPSMVPTLYAGHRLVVLRGGRVRPGSLVVGRYRSKPSVLAVKRAVRPADGGWEVVADNAFAPAPPGVMDVESVVLLRYCPLLRRS
jgi:signal peptidase I